jgi:hypothetical protein
VTHTPETISGPVTYATYGEVVSFTEEELKDEVTYTGVTLLIESLK